MADLQAMITDQIRDDVRRRAASAASESHMARLLFEALAAAQVDWRTVSLEEVKQLHVDAVRAFRRARPAPVAVAAACASAASAMR